MHEQDVSLIHLDDTESQRLLQIALDLVSFDSDSTEEKEEAVGKYIYDFFSQLGLPVEKQFCGEHRFNVIVRIPGKDRKHTIMYSGHMDVVPEGNLKEWTTPAYEPAVRDGRLYGRGACDMKGSLACSMFMAEYFVSHRIVPETDILLIYDVDEEISNIGLRKYLENPMSAVFCVVGEPTDLRLCTGHRGVMAFTIKLTGKSCHAGKWKLGKNPINAAASLILRLQDLQEVMERSPQKYLGASSVQVTEIRGGERVNVIPETVTLRVDRRLTAGETRKSAAEQLSQIVSDTASPYGIRHEITTTTYCPAGMTAEEDPSVLYIQKLLSFYGMDAAVQGFGASCEAGMIQEKLGIPVVIFGPGSIDQAHKVNEFIALESLKRGTELYIVLFKNYISYI